MKMVGTMSQFKDKWKPEAPCLLIIYLSNTLNKVFRPSLIDEEGVTATSLR